MNKIIRWTKEGWFMLFFLENPFTYYANRLGLLGDKKVSIRLRNGIVYHIRSNTSDGTIIDELWHRRIYDRLIGHLKPGATAIDIGGQIGVFTVKAGRNAERVNVFSFEPVPANYQFLKENIKTNCDENLVKAFNVAVAGQVGSLTLYLHGDETGGGSMYAQADKPATAKIDVPTTTLAKIFEEHNINRCDFLKMDCEGAELPILLNAPAEVLKKIESMTIEWHDDLNAATMTLDNFKKFLERAGFAVDFDIATATLYAERRS